jgi:CMP-N,N'-diacetyllegionaminic acid synthase
MSQDRPRIVALIPARSGSVRVPDKNIRFLGKHPLIAHTIQAALRSDIFDAVIVSTDSEKYADISKYYGAEAPFLRPMEFSREVSPDIEWVEYTLKKLKGQERLYDCFSILRPTSPFRQPQTICRGWAQFLSEKGVDSLRAIEKCKQHPGKMWVVRGNRIFPLLPLTPSEQPWHSSQYHSLPEVYVQNASLEIAWSRVVFQGRTIAGNTILPFFTQDFEGFDINTDYDWKLAEELIVNGDVLLPEIKISPYRA